MKYEINDIIKHKHATTNSALKVIDIENDCYYCEKGVLEDGTFLGCGVYITIPYGHIYFYEYVDMDVDIVDSENLCYSGLTDANISNIITLKVQGKTPQEITNYTHCSLDDVEAVLKTYDFLESRETLEKADYIVKCDELEFVNKNLQEELQMVYREIARRLLFHNEIQ